MLVVLLTVVGATELLVITGLSSRSLVGCPPRLSPLLQSIHMPWLVSPNALFKGSRSGSGPCRAFSLGQIFCPFPL